MAKEFERAGLATVLVTALAPLAKRTGANRIVAGVAMSYPCGDPFLSSSEEGELRRKIVETAFEALQTEVGGPTIFTPNFKWSGILPPSHPSSGKSGGATESRHG
jgi:glycine reductase complex component B subunit gamma